MSRRTKAAIPSHGFKFRAPVGRYLHVTVKDGVQGIGGYISGKPYVATLRVDRYKRALTFLGTGRAAVADRRPARSDFFRATSRRSTSRLPASCPTSCSTSRRRCGISRAPRSTTISRTSSSNVSSTTRDYSGKQPGKPTYDSIDLGDISTRRRAGRRGLFVRPSPRARLAAARAPRFRRGGRHRRRRGLEDTRLILVTDLGFIVKEAKDGSRDVFVQSIRTGLPVEGAQIDMVGSNGLTDVVGDDRSSTAGHSCRGRRRTERETRKDAAADPRAERRGHVLHAAPIERARDRPLALRYRRRGERAVGATAVNLPVFGPRHLSTGRDDASRRHHADRRLESVAGRPSTRRRHH